MDENHTQVFKTPVALIPKRNPLLEMAMRMYENGTLSREDVEAIAGTSLPRDEREERRHRIDNPQMGQALRDTKEETAKVFAFGLDVTQPQSHAYVRQTGGKKDGTDGQASVPGSVRRSGGRPRTWWERFIAYIDWILGGSDRRGTAYW